MQQIERYGVIVLVFLLVTIVAVSFWGDGKSPGFWQRLTGKAKKEEVAKVDPVVTAPAPVVTAENALVGGAPLDTSATSAAWTAQTPPPDALAAQPIVANEPSSLSVSGGQAATIVPAPDAATPLVNAIQPVVIPPPVVAPTNSREYVVRKGDSLALIARRALGREDRWTEIQALNPGVTPKSLKIGMKLTMPDGASVAPAETKVASRETKPAPKASAKPTKAAKAPESKAGSRYTIQRGDTLNAIAEKRLGSKSRVKEILTLNPGLDPKRLAVGQSIALPSGAAADKAPLVASAVSSSRGSDRPRVK